MMDEQAVKSLLRIAAGQKGTITTPGTRVSARYQDLEADHVIIPAPGPGKKIILTYVSLRNASTTNSPFCVLSDGPYNVDGLNELLPFKVSAGASGGSNPNTAFVPLSENTELNVRNVTGTGAGLPDVYIQVYYFIISV